ACRNATVSARTARQSAHSARCASTACLAGSASRRSRYAARRFSFGHVTRALPRSPVDRDCGIVEDGQGLVGLDTFGMQAVAQLAQQLLEAAIQTLLIDRQHGGDVGDTVSVDELEREDEPFLRLE